MINIDGKNYPATFVAGLNQTVDITNGGGSGRLQNSYKMFLEYQASFLNHKGQLRRDSDCTDQQWFDIWMLISNPVNKHTIVFPFGPKGQIKQEVYITTVAQQIHKITEVRNTYNNTIDVTFTAIGPFWKAGGTIQGVI